MASKYAVACAERGVKEIAVHVPVELRQMVDALIEREDVRLGAFIEDLLVEKVNAANLLKALPVGVEGPPSPWTFTPEPKERKARETIKDLKEQLAALQAQIEAAKAPLVPTPPDAKADPKTGVVS